MGKAVNIPLIADMKAENKDTEYLWWVGSAGAFDDRYKKVSREFAKILTYLNTNYAILGPEEFSSGDIARRAGNEMLFQMQALMNIEVLNSYGVKKIITSDPHVFNCFKHEYPDFDGNYEIIHHSQFLLEMIENGKLKFDSKNIFAGKTATYHDPCYLGRLNKIYNPPRQIIKALNINLKEMHRNKSFALCCGAGGGQMFKEAEKGDKEVFIERTEDAMKTNTEMIITACPYCMVMMTDGIKYKNKEENIKNYDIAELVSKALNL